MKKEFMEPEMRRIELNLKERIATSLEETGDIIGGFRTRVSGVANCVQFVSDTEISPSQLGPNTPAEVWSCYVTGNPQDAINALNNM